MAKRKVVTSATLIEPDLDEAHLRKRHKDCFSLAALALLSFKGTEACYIDTSKVETQCKLETKSLPIVEAGSDDESVATSVATESCCEDIKSCTVTVPSPPLQVLSSMPRFPSQGVLRKPMGFPSRVVARVGVSQGGLRQLPLGRPLPPAPVLPRMFVSANMMPLQILPSSSKH
jgi:hypothetical protein